MPRPNRSHRSGSTARRWHSLRLLTLLAIVLGHLASAAPVARAAQTLPDTTPPPAPVDVSAGAGNAQVSLAWGPVAADDLAGYQIFRDTQSPVNVAGAPLTGALLTTVSYVDHTAANDTAYNYVVAAVDEAGNKSYSQEVSATPSAALPRPQVAAVRPANGATGVSVNGGIATDLLLPNGGVEASTMPGNVRLVKVSTNAEVPATIGTSGGYDVITLQPLGPLEPLTQYRFEVGAGVTDQAGMPFIPFSSSFTTGSGNGPVSTEIEFDKIRVNAPTDTDKHTSLAIGPDSRLYASTDQGKIKRWDIAADGTLINPPLVINTLTNARGPRLLIGMAFDPASTPANPILWISHGDVSQSNAADWSSAVSRLSGANLQNYQDYVVNLPRSGKDHAANSLAFSPSGRLHLIQGSNSAMGAPDSSWLWRPEHLLSAAVLEINTAAIPTPPLDVKTEQGGSYNPFAPGAPVTIYARGIRNAYDLVWHSNGFLYAAANGSAAGGNVPQTPAALGQAACATRPDGGYSGSMVGTTAGNTPSGTYSAPSSQNSFVGGYRVGTTQRDWLFKVEKDGYYGHPNPARCEWVMNGGNPTSFADGAAEVASYAVGTQPDPNYKGWAYDFGLNKSPNGMIEYRSNTFGGALKGKLLVVRFSNNDDIMALTPSGASGAIASAQEGASIPGFSGFVDPLDLTEDTRNGNIYVSEYAWQSSAGQQITLLRPRGTAGAPAITVPTARLIFSDVSGGAASADQPVTVQNLGTATLNLNAASITGAGSSQFQISSGGGATTVGVNASHTINVAFNPTSTGVKVATLNIPSNDPARPMVQVELRGLGTAGTGGSLEPSLQWVLDTFNIPVNVGDPDPATPGLPASALLGEEQAIQSFVKAGAGSVTVEPLAVFGATGANPVVTFGWYETGAPSNSTPLFSVSNSPTSNGQRLNPPLAAGGITSFDPADTRFGFSSRWPAFNLRDVYSDDALNTWEPTTANRHKVRVYPLKNPDGSAVRNAYVVATEETTSGYDYQDVVVVVRNVAPAPAGGTATARQINFQPAAAATPAGYTADSGAGYSAARGFGWATLATANSATPTPVDMTLNARERNVNSNKLLDTLIMMQGNGAANQPNTGAWLIDLPNGSYSVSVTVGDPSFTDSAHQLTIEGAPAFAAPFAPSTGNLFASATKTVQLADGRLSIVPTGTNTKITHLTITGAAQADTTPPTVSVSISGPIQSPNIYRGQATATVSAADDGSGVASVSYSVNGGAFQPYSAPVAFNEPGSYSVVARAADAAGNTATSSAATFEIVVPTTSRAQIAIENLDKVPYSDRLVMSRIGTSLNPTLSRGNKVHDIATLRVRNTGLDTLNITGLTIGSSSFVLSNTVALPLPVAPGGQVDLPIKFVAIDDGPNSGLHQTTLTIASDDPTQPNTVVELAGFWQSVNEGGQEPTFNELLSLFGYSTFVASTTVFPETPTSPLAGDEVRSKLWTRADPTKPVYARQLAAYHGCCTAQDGFNLTGVGSGSGSGGFQHLGAYGQSVLPLKTTGGPAEITLNPTFATFELKAAGYSTNTTGNLGIRMFPMRDRRGALIPNAYYMLQDFVQNGCGAGSANCDYNDNVYLVTNVRPAGTGAPPNPAAAAPIPGAAGLTLEFAGAVAGTLADGKGAGTGFASTQINKNDVSSGSNSYQPAQIDLSGGALRLGSSAGNNIGGNSTSTTGLLNNTQVNYLQTNVDTAAGKFTVSARLLGPLSGINAGGEEAGIFFGNDQNNFVKLAVVNNNGVPSIQLRSERGLASLTTTVHGAMAAVPSPASIGSLDLFLIGDPATGAVRAAYSVNGGALTTMAGSTTVTGNLFGRFFGANARAGVLASHRDGAAFTAVFDRFAVTAGDPTVAPSTPTAHFRLDVGASQPYTDTAGRVWAPDSGYFTPVTAPIEGNNGDPIAATDDDPLYRTYRGNVGNVAVAQRVLTYKLPLPAGVSAVDLRLHFAERYSGNNAVGKRLFDIEAEGAALRQSFDIFAAAGAINTAAVLDLTNVAVRDGELTLVFRAVADYPAINAIEVLCRTTCSSTGVTPTPTTPTATPTTPTATPTTPTATPTTPTATPTTPTPPDGTKTALLVVLGTDRGDQAVKARLEGLGYVVTVVGDSAATAADALGKTLVLVSSSVTSTAVNTKFRSVAVPVITWEDQIYDDMGMGLAGGTTANLTKVAIASPGHPLAAGLSGEPAVSSASVMTYGLPSGEVTVVATAPGNSGQALIFAYEQGAAMSGLTAPARRMGFFFRGSQPTVLTAAGWSLFDAAVAWAADASTSPTATPTATSGGSPTPADTWTEVSWASGPAQQFSNSEAQGAVVNGKLYVFGGFDSQKSCCTPTLRSYAFDPAANSWSPIANLPYLPNGASFGGVTHAGVATDGTFIYLAGGYTSNSSGAGQTFGTKQVWRYNPADNSYLRLADLPVERAAGQLYVLNGNLHYVGGTNISRTQDVGNHYVISIANAATAGAPWSELAPLPNPRHHAGGVAIDGRLYYIGGQKGHDGALVPQSDVHIYDPATNTWAVGVPLPQPRNHHGSSTFVSGGRIIILGGQGNNGQTLSASALAYTPGASAWVALTNLPQARHSGVGNALGGKLYFTTGSFSGTYVGTPIQQAGLLAEVPQEPGPGAVELAHHIYLPVLFSRPTR